MSNHFTGLSLGPPLGDQRLDRKRWLEQFIHLMGHTGNYTREEAIAAIDKEGTLPDVLSLDSSKPANYPNGRIFTDDDRLPPGLLDEK